MYPISPINHYSLENPGTIYDEEALSALELAARTAKKTNECVTAVNEIPRTVSDAVQGHIDNGTFDNQIDEFTDKITKTVDDSNTYNRGLVQTQVDAMTEAVNNLLGSVPEGVTSMDAEIIAARTDPYGTTHATLGDAIKAMTYRQYKQYGSTCTDLNGLIEPGAYTLTSPGTVLNNPLGSQGTCVRVLTHGSRGRWVTQIVKHFAHTSKAVYIRFGENTKHTEIDKNFAEGLSVAWGDWVKVMGERTNIKTAGVDINTIVDAGQYVIRVTDSVNKPDSLTSGYMLDVIDFQPWVMQYVYTITGMDVWCRRVRYDGSEQPSEWVKVAGTPEVDPTAFVKSNYGQTVVCFGDSITDFEKDGTSLTGFIEAITGATVQNVGFGGCRMSPHTSDDYEPYSMCELVDAVASGDFTPQESGYYAGGKRVNTLKGIDFSDVDIVSIEYGTNDFTGDVKLDNDTGTPDKTTFGGSLRYSIETLLTAYPNLRIVLVAPTWRYWMNADDTFKDDSDTHTNSKGNKLHDFVDKVIEIGNDYHIPVVNPYDNMGISKLNRDQWFRPGDGTHPSTAGQKMLAKQISAVLATM